MKQNFDCVDLFCVHLKTAFKSKGSFKIYDFITYVTLLHYIQMENKMSLHD